MVRGSLRHLALPTNETGIQVRVLVSGNGRLRGIPFVPLSCSCLSLSLHRSWPRRRCFSLSVPTCRCCCTALACLPRMCAGMRASCAALLLPSAACHLKREKQCRRQPVSLAERGESLAVWRECEATQQGISDWEPRWIKITSATPRERERARHACTGKSRGERAAAFAASIIRHEQRQQQRRRPVCSSFRS